MFWLSSGCTWKFPKRYLWFYSPADFITSIGLLTKINLKRFEAKISSKSLFLIRIGREEITERNNLVSHVQ